MIRERIDKLRELMRARNISAYIVPNLDPHQSEYIADHYKMREFISGFTGSAGTVVITLEKAGLWTDGRYFIQAKKELNNSGIELFKEGIEGTPTIVEFINDNLGRDETIAFDGETYSYSNFLKLKKELIIDNFKIDENLVDLVWEKRPKLPKEKICIHDIKYSGMTSNDKLSIIRKKMLERQLDYYLVSSLDDINYLFNIRGKDILYTPVVISYAFITMEEAYLFVDLDKVEEDVRRNLNENGIILKDYFSVFDFIKSIDKNKVLFLNPEKTNIKLFNSIPIELDKVLGLDIISYMKSVKNSVEIENQKTAYIKDGVALVKFLNWLEKNILEMEITEISAAEKLLEFRKEQDLFMEPSFNTISAYGENAALPHYSPSDLNPVILENKGLYLIDSGGQYLDGTTDITRTIALGEITEEESLHYTLTLKAHIALMLLVFKKGTKSSSLDIIARQPLWKYGLDYNHGTGHGVGYVLGVHEGPQRIAPIQNDVDMIPGMITSNEPGMYVEGSHGIRIENIMICVDKNKSDFGDFYGFETLSFCPIDLKPVNIDLLTGAEIKWINSYHENCYNNLSKYLEGIELDYLREKTKAI